jgi:dTDP-4-dehydrorhamnose reductase
MAKEVVAILGGKGMLGTDVAETCKQRGFDARIFDLPEFDITDPEQIRRALDTAEMVVNCAAYTDVDGAEKQRDQAYKVNAEAVGWLGMLARRAKLWVLHIGTDFVFDGKADRPYVETDRPNPINEYGRSKLAGEQLLVESGCDNCIMRAQWTYGRSGKNFVTKLLDRARAAKMLKVIDDQIGSPTATTELAKVICKLLQRKPQGIFHFAADGYVSRYEMAKFIVSKLAMDVDVVPCKTSDYVSAAARPLNSRFDCSKIKALLNEPIEPWQGPLERFLGRI